MVGRGSDAVTRSGRGARLAARTLLVLVLAVLVAGTTFVGGLLAAPLDVRAVPPAPKPVLLLGADGTQFGQIRPAQRREVLRGEDIPEVMRQAIISAEDSRFLDHKGVDPIATLRAAYRDLTGGRRQGGSTITQQYVKNVYVGNDRTFGRKIREAAVAVRLENRKSKDDILTDYLNVLYLGNSTYGVQAASKYYYGVDVKDLALEKPGQPGAPDEVLALARASMLAGIAPAPSAWNPVEDFAQARLRQKYTLNQMVSNGYVTPQQASEAFRREAAVLPKKVTPPEPPSTAPEYADIVTAQLQERFADDPDQLDRGGLRVRTALDTDLQEAVTRAAREVLPDQDDPQAAVVAVDISSGDVTAMTTLRRAPAKGDRPEITGYTRGGFNLAINGRRSTGSTIKPFTLAAALEKGLTLDTRRSAPSCDTIEDPNAEGGSYRYCNAAGEGGSSRRLSLQRALQGSVNTVYVPLAIEAGRPRIKQLMLDAGVVASEAAFATAPSSFGLGTTALASPLSMASAYGTLMNAGVHVAPRYLLEVRDVDGGLVSREPEQPEPVRRALSPQVAEQVVEAMSGVTARGGTARSARQDFTVYGKTGTTNDSTNAWFIGCSREGRDVCLAVWMGYDDESCGEQLTRSCGGMKDVNGVEQVYGGTLPADIYDRTWEILDEVQARRAAEPSG
ncbi:MAG: Multimodular transpeptidase-transglycosylase [uncultured Frankineae bacterium]|uniref:Multimodular transpeptidase-transglycosylase n=1 Tax=uncultured Frankineae bacterium TaxID=437475 RepID=A0A6J4MEK7_9ACTN|nr:MAG: Multimodular transpeptidase-transglycosylase [uncultured Frankineae bacterium]